MYPACPARWHAYQGGTLENQLAVSFASMNSLGALFSRPASMELIILTLAVIIVTLRLRRKDVAQLDLN